MKPGIELTLSGSVTSAKALLVHEVKVSVTQLGLTLWDPMVYSPPAPLSTEEDKILVQARLLEWVAISSSRGSS